MIRRPTRPDPKLIALKESGAANPRPRSVRDPNFTGNDFFDPRDLIQVRYEMLRRVRTDGQSVSDATWLFGVSRPTFYKAQENFARSGLFGLLPAKRGPHGPHKITGEIQRFLAQAAAGGAAVDAQDLAARIAERFGVVVHQRTVRRALAHLKKNGDEPRRHRPRRPCLGGALRAAEAKRRGFEG